MPDPDDNPEFKLTDAEGAIAKEWVKTHLATNGCPVCKKKKFSVEGNLMELRSVSKGNYLGGKFNYFPTVVAVCDACGHMVLFNAKKMGIRIKAKATPPDE